MEQSKIRCVAERFKQERERLGLSQAQVAEIVGVSRRAVINYEKSLASIRIDVLASLSQHGFDSVWIMLGERKEIFSQEQKIKSPAEQLANEIMLLSLQEEAASHLLWLAKKLSQ